MCLPEVFNCLPSVAALFYCRREGEPDLLEVMVKKALDIMMERSGEKQIPVLDTATEVPEPSRIFGHRGQ